MRAGRRTGALAIGRVALGGLLLAAMWALYTASFSGEATFTGSGTDIGKRLNRFAESFAITFFIVQATAVLLLTPVFVAGAIFEERETRSGEVLLTTELTRREVYVGKLGARMIQVMLVVLAGMPILFLTQLWGGVSLAMICVNYAAACFTVIGAGVVTAAVSAYAESMRAAILRSYLLLFMIDVVLLPASPYLVIVLSAAHWGAGLAIGLILFVPLQATIILCGYVSGQRWLRMAMLRQRRHIAADEGPPPLPGSEMGRATTLTDRHDPLLWKEMGTYRPLTMREIGRGLIQLPGSRSIDDRIDRLGVPRWLFTSRETMAFICRLLLGLVIFLCLLAMMLEQISPSWVARIGGGVALGWMMIAIGLSSASGVSRERQKQTLIDLLMLPGPRRDLLKAKAIASLHRGKWPLWVAIGLILVAMVFGGASPLAVPALVVSLGCYAVFAVGLGTYISTRCKNLVNANGTWIGAMFGVVIGTFLIAEANAQLVLEADRPPRFDYPTWSRMTNPMLSWGRLCFYAKTEGMVAASAGRDPIPITLDDWWPALVCPAIYGAIGLLCWRIAVRRFEQDGRT